MSVHINYHGASQETSRTSKQQRNNVTVLVPPGGSWRKPRKHVDSHVPPSGSSCAARRFLEKSRKHEIKQKVMFSSIQV